MKHTLRYNENLNLEILELYYVKGFKVKEIHRKIRRKICIDNIRKIISEHKLYLEFKKCRLEITPAPE